MKEGSWRWQAFDSSQERVAYRSVRPSYSSSLVPIVIIVVTMFPSDSLFLLGTANQQFLRTTMANLLASGSRLPTIEQSTPERTVVSRGCLAFCRTEGQRRRYRRMLHPCHRYHRERPLQRAPTVAAAADSMRGSGQSIRCCC